MCVCERVTADAAVDLVGEIDRRRQQPDAPAGERIGSYQL